MFVFFSGEIDKFWNKKIWHAKLGLRTGEEFSCEGAQASIDCMQEEAEEGLGILWQIVLIISLITTITFIKRITIHSSSISNLLEPSNKFSFEWEPLTE